jgi:hypothetical protein
MTIAGCGRSGRLRPVATDYSALTAVPRRNLRWVGQRFQLVPGGGLMEVRSTKRERARTYLKG